MGWLLSGLIVGPLLYILVTLSSPRLRSVEDYQFGERCLNPSDVVDASMMYGLQIAAVALFSTWGFLYGVSALVVPLFWVLGYLLFSLVLSDQFLAGFATESRFRTLHGFLADHGRVRSVRVLAAILTLVGLAGPAMVEAFTVGRAVAAAIPTFGGVGGAGLALGFLAVSLIYMTRGGFPGVVRLNQLQMMFGYGGFCSAVAGFMILFLDRVGAGPVFWLALCGFITSSGILILKLQHDAKTRRYLDGFKGEHCPSQTRDVLGLLSVGIGAASFGGAGLFAFLALGASISDASLPNLFGSSDQYGFTLLATLSLFVANAFYQFVDVTQWQRLLSLAVNRDDLPAVAGMLRSNVVTGGTCSALTWVLAIIFGMFLRGLFPEPDADPYSLLQSIIGTALTTAEFWAGPLVFLTVTALVAIMLSTLDAIVAATAFTVQEDLLGIESGRGSLAAARFVTLLVVIVQLIFYLAVGAAAGDRIDAVLYVCWSFQLAMMPVACGLIIGRGGSYIARCVSMLAGCLAALWPLIIGSPERAFEISPIAALGAALAFYLLFGGARRIPRAEPPL